MVTGNASNIRAGGAFVELGTTDVNLKKGLADGRNALGQFQKGATTVTGKIALRLGRLGGSFKAFSAVATGAFRAASAAARVFGASVAFVSRTMISLTTTAYRLAVSMASVAWAKFKQGAMLAAAVIGVSLKVYADFEEQLANVASLLDDSDQHMGRFKKGIEALSVEFGESVEALAGGLYDIISASVPAAEALEVLKAATIAAKAGMTDTRTAADLLTTILNSYNIAAKHSTAVTDILFTIIKRGKTDFSQLAATMGRVTSLAAKSGVKFEELAAALSTMTRSGVSTAESVTAMTGIIKAFLSPTEDAIRIANDLGFEMSGATLKTKGLFWIFQKIKDLPADTVAKLFPVEALRGVLPLLGNMRGFLDDLVEAQTTAGSTQLAFGKMTDTLAQGFNVLKQSVLGMLREIGDVFGPTLSVAMESLEEWVNEASGWIETHGEELKGIILSAWTWVAFYATRAWEWIKENVLARMTGEHEVTWDGIKKTAETLWEKLKVLWKTGVALLKDIIDWVELFFEDPEAAGRELADVLNDVIDTMLSMVDFAGKGADKFLEHMASFMNGLVDELDKQGFSDKILDLLVKVFSLTGRMLSAVTNWSIAIGKEIGKSIGNAILDALLTTVNFLQKLAQKIPGVSTIAPSLGTERSSGLEQEYIRSGGRADPSLYASGGIVTQPTLAIVGEAGPEAIIPLTGPNAGTVPGAGGGVNVNINVRNPLDPAVVSRIQQGMRRLRARGRN